MNAQTPLIIDTDSGWDDWLALLFLMRRTDVQILGVTVTGAGEAHLGPGMANIQKLLAFGGQSAKVYAGFQRPLQYSNVFPPAFRSTIDTFWGLTVPPSPPVQPFGAIDAVDFLFTSLAEAAARGTTVDLLCIGGFTNLGALIQRYPVESWRAGLGTVYAMGGAVGVPGNVYTAGDPEWGYYASNTTAEWNLFVDPLGAKLTLTAGLRVVLVPLDATQFVPVSQAFVDDYATRVGTDVYAGFVLSILKLQAGQTSFFDPLAAAVAVTPLDAGLVTTATLRLSVETELDEEHNTVGALSSAEDPAWTEVIVAMTADADRFYALFDAATLPPPGAAR